jgi:hypothetical protein
LDTLVVREEGELGLELYKMNYAVCGMGGQRTKNAAKTNLSHTAALQQEYFQPTPFEETAGGSAWDLTRYSKGWCVLPMFAVCMRGQTYIGSPKRHTTLISGVAICCPMRAISSKYGAIVPYIEQKQSDTAGI